MLFLTRIRYWGIKSITNQCKRHYSSGVVNQYHHVTKSRVLDRNELYGGFVRFFAAPVMVSVMANKPKPEEKGLRLNDKIKADFVRLVGDDGHGVVSRHEALDRARNLKLDLVEVDRSAKPPVCKIMDYHKEKYKHQVKEKERAKSKAEGTLRKGPGKEIRFTEKTEKKDLQTKADTVKRMIEKGFRVKCMAVGTEDQDLGGMLTRLTSLIEDVAVVESGPMVEKKQAYVIVRHMKFGLKKGSSKKTSMASTSPRATALNSEPLQGPLEVEEELDDVVSHSESEDDIDPGQMETPFGDPEENRMAWSTLDANEDFEKIFGFEENNKGAVSSSIARQIGGETDGVFPLEDIANVTLPTQGPSLVGENRYSGQSEARSRLQRTMSPESAKVSEYSPVHSSPVNKDPGATNTVPRGPTQVGQNRYGGQSEVRSRFQPTVLTERLADISKLSESSPAHTSHVSRGPGSTITIPRGPTQEGENRYGGRNEVRSRFQPPNSTERTTDNTKLSEFSPVHPSQVNKAPGATNTVPRGPTQVVENRYGGRTEVRSRFHPTNSTERIVNNTKLSEFSPVHTSQVNRVPSAPHTLHRGSESPYQERQPQRDVSDPMPIEHKPFRTDASPFGNLKRPSTDEALKREQSSPNAPGQRPSYGIFSASNHPAPSRASVPTELKVDAKPIAEDSQRPEADKTGRWGIFGK